MDLNVQEKFNSYPEAIAPLLYQLRELIFKVVKQDTISELTETLKWGEPSYAPHW